MIETGLAQRPNQIPKVEMVAMFSAGFVALQHARATLRLEHRAKSGVARLFAAPYGSTLLHCARSYDRPTQTSHAYDITIGPPPTNPR